MKCTEDGGYIEWTFTAIQSSPIRRRVPVATKKDILMNRITWIEIEDNLIGKATNYLDALGFVLQVGSKVEYLRCNDWCGIDGNGLVINQ